jgi:hypothetical protein
MKEFHREIAGQIVLGKYAQEIDKMAADLPTKV